MTFSIFSVSSLARKCRAAAYPAALIALLLVGMVLENLPGEAPVYPVEASNADLAHLPLMYD